MVYKSALYFAPLLAAAVNAANDWNTPCFSGTCSYDLPATNASSPSGTLNIWGSENAISDITAAAGWMMLSCSPNTTTQSVRLVCNSTDNAGCEHLFQNNGAVNKLVRLPEDCGTNAFARVANSYVSQDQSIPSTVARSIFRRDGSTPQVQGLDLDTNFSAIDPTASGTVGLAIQGLNAPGYNSSVVVPVPAPNTRRRRTPLSARSIGDFAGDVEKFVGDVLGSLNNVNLQINDQLPPININDNINLVDASVNCAKGSASVKVDVNPNVQAVIDVGAVVVGTIVPPKFSQFNLFATMNADLAGNVALTADATGNVDSGAITLLNLGLPGLDFPGILQLGPAFKVNAQFTASLDAQIDLQVGLDFKVNNAEIVFPPNSQVQSKGAFNVQDTQLALSVSPSVKATGNVAAHLIPTLDIGINAFDLVNADIFIDLDSAAVLNLDLQASTSIIKNLTDSNNNGNSNSANSGSDSKNNSSGYSASTSTSKESASTTVKKVVAVTASSKDRRAATTISLLAPSASSSSSSKSNYTASSSDSSKNDNSGDNNDSDFEGCIDIQLDFAVNAGADANLFDLFDENDTITLFQKNFDLFQKCFGNAPSNNNVKTRGMFDNVPVFRKLRQRTAAAAAASKPTVAATSATSSSTPTGLAIALAAKQSSSSSSAKTSDLKCAVDENITSAEQVVSGLVQAAGITALNK